MSPGARLAEHRRTCRACTPLAACPAARRLRAALLIEAATASTGARPADDAATRALRAVARCFLGGAPCTCPTPTLRHEPPAAPRCTVCRRPVPPAVPRGQGLPATVAEALQVLARLGARLRMNDGCLETTAPDGANLLAVVLVEQGRRLAWAVAGTETGHTWCRCAVCGEERLVAAPGRCRITPGCRGRLQPPEVRLMPDADGWWRAVVPGSGEPDRGADPAQTPASPTPPARLRVVRPRGLPAEPPESLAEAAVAYARAGWLVLPLRPGAKTPLTKRGVHEATCDVDRVRDWWRRWPRANIGVATGHVFDVLDVDAPEGFDSLAELRDGIELQLWPEAVETPSGGMHLWTCPTRRGNTAGHRPGLDWRGRGGYVVVPPSRVEGRPYRWLAWPPAILAEAPAALLVAVFGEDRRPQWTAIAWRSWLSLSRRSEGRIQRLLECVRGASVGNRNNVLFWAACRLVEEGGTDEDLDRLRWAARDAGLEAREIDRTIASAVRRASTGVSG